MNPRSFRALGVIVLLVISQGASAAVIGVDNVHGFNAQSVLASGSSYHAFRSVLAFEGHTLVPLSSFNAAELAGLDALIVKIPFQNPFSAGEMAAIHAFTDRAVFTSDSSMFADADIGADRSITFGDNQRLLENILSYIAAGPGTLFVGDAGFGHNAANFNALVAPYGISYSGSGADGSGRTITSLAPHFITAGVSSIGIDFQLQMAISAPSLSLSTSGVALDQVVAVWPVPEPASIALLGMMTFAIPWGTRQDSH